MPDDPVSLAAGLKGLQAMMSGEVTVQGAWPDYSLTGDNPHEPGTLWHYPCTSDDHGTDATPPDSGAEVSASVPTGDDMFMMEMDPKGEAGSIEVECSDTDVSSRPHDGCDTCRLSEQVEEAAHIDWSKSSATSAAAITQDDCTGDTDSVPHAEHGPDSGPGPGSGPVSIGCPGSYGSESNAACPASTHPSHTRPLAQQLSGMHLSSAPPTPATGAEASPLAPPAHLRRLMIPTDRTHTGLKASEDASGEGARAPLGGTSSSCSPQLPATPRTPLGGSPSARSALARNFQRKAFKSYKIQQLPKVRWFVQIILWMYSRPMVASVCMW